MQTKPRPTGVTIIAILNIIGGIVMLIGGIALIALGAILPSIPPSAFEDPDIQAELAEGNIDLSDVSPSMLGGLGIAIGGVLFALAVVSFIVAYGLLKGIGWSWTLTVILSIVSIAFNVISMIGGNFSGIISIIISGIILYYLYRPHVKAYFGRGAKPPAPASQP